MDVRARRLRLALGAEQPVEPAVAQRPVGARSRVGCGGEGPLELAQRDRLFLLGTGDRVRLAGELRVQRLPRRDELQPVGVQARGLGLLQLAELLAVAVGLQHGEARLCGPQRQLVAPEAHPGGEDRVLERVLLLGELARDQAALTGLPQAVEALPLAALGAVLGLSERLELAAREEVRVARDDRCLLRDVLLADAHGAALLGTLEVVALEAGFVVGGGADGGRGHARHTNGARHPRRRVTAPLRAAPRS